MTHCWRGERAFQGVGRQVWGRGSRPGLLYLSRGSLLGLGNTEKQSAEVERGQSPEYTPFEPAMPDAGPIPGFFLT